MSKTSFLGKYKKKKFYVQTKAEILEWSPHKNYILYLYLGIEKDFWFSKVHSLRKLLRNFRFK